MQVLEVGEWSKWGSWGSAEHLVAPDSEAPERAAPHEFAHPRPRW